MPCTAVLIVARKYPLTQHHTRAYLYSPVWGWLFRVERQLELEHHTTILWPCDPEVGASWERCSSHQLFST